ncbi:MAG: TniQ family protein [Chloroflexota bacterium]
MNDIQPRLVLQIPMYPGESWVSFFYRVGVHNYDEAFRLVEGICREYLRNQQIKDNFLCPQLPKTMSFLGNLTWVSEQQVYEATLHRFAPTLTPFSHPITSIEFCDGVSRPVLEATKHHQFVAPHEARFCPLCLREQPFHRLDWSLNLILACRKHQCLLANCCPACGSALTIPSIVNTECQKCHASLLKTRVTSLRNDILGLYSQETLASWLAGELETESRDLLEIPDVSARAAYTFISGLVQAMRNRDIGEALHSPDIDWKAQNKRTFRPNFELYYDYQVVTTALKAVANWPRSFYEFLDHYRVLPERWLSGGLQTHFRLAQR